MIPGRSVALAGLLGAAVGGPYVVSQAPDQWPTFGPSTPAQRDTAPAATAADPTTPPNLSDPTGPGAEVYTTPARLAGPVGITIEQALDWNVTRNWVYRHWARKSTGLADPTLFGVRVPLVTGSAMTDIAGSLTYYFDHQGVLQRIRLNARTADTSRIVHLAASRFGMQTVAPRAAGDQLLQQSDGKLLRGELRTRPQGTLWGTSPHASFDVRFEATRPGSTHTVTPEGANFEIPQVAANPAPPAAPTDSSQPIFPPRAIVPDQPGSTAAAAGEPIEAAEADQPIGGPPTPKLPELGKPTAAPPPAIEPLNGYRERFRWPG